MQKSITIPVALQLIADDVGWHNGADERHLGRPARSGLPRMHQPEDYTALNEIGKGLNMKVVCSMVLGEWDKNNVLRGVPHVTWDEKGWDRASGIDMQYAEKCMAAAESGAYLDYALHGLMHGYYDNGRAVTQAQYYPLKYDPEKGVYTKEFGRLSREEFERQIQLFLQIYHSWGFQKKITTFVSPCGTKGTYDDNLPYAQVIRKYGMLYWANSWGAETETVAVEDGVICTKQFGNMPWNAYGIDPAYLDIYIKDGERIPGNGYGVHWTNFIRFNPENNLELVPAWIAYFNRQAEVFGVMLSRDNGFSSSQAVYSRFARMDVGEGRCRIDLSQVDAKDAPGLRREFYVSFRKGLRPQGCIGGTIREYEERKEFVIYEISRTTGSLVDILL